MTPARRYLPVLATRLLAFFVLSFLPPLALGQSTCSAPKNAIQAENCLPGTPSSQWYIQGVGSPNIQGFTTDIGVNAGQTISFKISTNAASYRIDIYRLGYYQGNDGRFITSISPSAHLPQIQPACLTDSAAGLIDCGNWGISASWTVPSTATSGFYFARFVRPDTGEVGAAIFIVRNDSSRSDILEQASDTTWQAYNDYGGNSLYKGNPVGRAYKVSYNRPVNTLGDFFAYEYPIVHFLEANGYDVTYSTGIDTDRNGALITQHKVWLSVGHDEYWSGGQRANVEAARDAAVSPVNLAFLTGNEVFWKTRWEPSIDGTNTPYRTLVCYKESFANARIDPLDSGSSPTWTGFWRDPRFSPPADGGRPENALTGTIGQVSAPQANAITVPQADGKMRFWRNTSIATLGPGQVATLPQGGLGYESDEDMDNGFRPAGLIRLSSTTAAVTNYIYFSPTSGYYFANGTETHHLTMYRAPTGALVFGAGTINWSSGIESDRVGSTGPPADPNMRQAMVNLLADMGAQPAILQNGLAAATASTDTSPPRSTITSPAPGTTVTAGSQVTISGTSQDLGGGVVGGVEVSVDGGSTWHPAVGRENWSYVFTAATSGPLNALSRAVDDSGNLEVVSPGTETVFVSPSSVSLSANQQKQFTATVTATSNQTVNWSISAVNPPSAPAGNLSSSGLYTAPATITPAQVTIKATSADGTASGTATVNLSNGAVANFVGTDTSTQGNWHGVYGADGYSIANDTQSLPAYASFAVQNQLNYTWATGISDPRAPQTGSNTGRIASVWYNSSSFNFDVNFTDGNTHRFALYALDWDSTVRAETVQIVDANTSAVLDTRNISLFHNGIYLIWNLSGHVKINVTLNAGGNAVISGAFFGGSTGAETVTVSPASVSLSANQQKQFTATVTGTANQTVSWTISAVNPPSAPAGNLSSSGLYTAPATITPAQVTIKATSADGTASGTATVNLSNGAVANITTERYDQSRLGANLNETQLNTSNVNVNTFGKLWSYQASGSVYAQPLYVQNVTIPGKGAHNVLYVVTMNDVVYAFDADSSSNTPLLSLDLTTQVAGSTPVPITDMVGPGLNIVGNVGIESTPYIDLSTNTMYLVARTKESADTCGTVNGNYCQRLHALDIATFAEKLGGPVVIQGSVSGTGNASVGGTLTFDPKIHNQRSSLALANGQILIAWASHEDLNPYHGWVMSYNASNLQQTGIWSSSPDGFMAGIWMAGRGPAVDASGNVYYMVGNGDWNGTRNFGESMVKFGSTPGMPLLDWFTPDSLVSAGDIDYGSSGPILIPGTDLIAGAGKTSTFYVMHTGNLGHESAGNGQIVQSLANNGGEVKGGPVYWNRSAGSGPWMYVWSDGCDFLKAYHFNGTTFDTGIVSESTIASPCGQSGGVLTLSANGSTAGSGIIWSSMPLADDADHGVHQGVLRAFNADDLTKELWNSRLNATRDDSGNWPKFSPPTVVNGRVYMASFPADGVSSAPLNVYGLLPTVETVTISPSSASLSANQQKQFTATVTATSNQTVSWTISAVSPASAPAGNISSTTGLYTAPATITPAQVTIKATSADGTASGTATVTLSNGPAANFTGSDTSTQGNWHGVYGADGYSIANDTQSLPAYVSFAVQNQLNYTWATGISDPRALQTGSNTGRIASTWYSSSSFAFDVNFTDGNSHRFALYALDWDGSARAETVQIVDANTSAVLDTRNISLFHNGIYLIWNLFGHVKINVTLTAGGNAVISGAFFGGSTGSETVTVSPPSVTLSANQQKQFTATVTGTSNQTVSWSISAVSPPSAPSGNISSTTGLYTAPATITPAQVTIKATSADGTASGTATVNLSNGAVANFIGSDTSTQGNWHGVYGADGYSIANDTPSLPAYASFAVQNQLSYTWATGISDPRALQNGSNTGRIASAWYSSSSFAFDVNFTDGNSHRFALYALDWDSTARAESVQVVDANSGAVLDTRNLSLFNNGIYLIWNLSGHVKINVTLTAGGNAVISGAFFK